MKQAIVLAAFGSRHKNSVASLDRITRRVREAHPDIPVRLAYTSTIIRGHMKKAGEAVDSVADALDKLQAEGITHVVIQSLHLIPGMEFHELLGLANEHMLKDGGFARVEVGFPLVSSEKNVAEVAEIVLTHALEGRGENDAVLFMGHGSRHDGNVYYEAMHRAFQKKDPTVHMGVMEHTAEAGIDAIVERFKADGVKKAYLLPFLFGAGWHAAKDMVGDSEDSWKTRLESEGIACEPVLKGAGEYDQLVAIWLHHLDDALARLTRS